MAVSLDLDDPVSTIVTLLETNISKTPHTMITGFTRGGYEWGNNKPRIIPIEGEVTDSGVWNPRQGRRDIRQIPGQHEIYVLKVDKNIDEASRTADHKYADKYCRLQIDIYTSGGYITDVGPPIVYNNNPRLKLYKLFREIEAIIYLFKTNPGGNWSEVDPLSDRELTNRNTQLWRITYDVMLRKISDFIGSA